MQSTVVNTTGVSTGKIDLPEEIFAQKGNLKLLSQAVRIYLSNQRHAASKVKTRSEVSGSGKKIWRQKGTGRARHGDAYAPIFVGGGIAHGPTGEQNYKMKLSKILRRKALLLALTKKLESKELVIVEGLEDVKPKTKQINQIIHKLAGDAKTVSVVVPYGNHSIIRGARNIEGIKLLPVMRLNAYDILWGGTLLVPKNSLTQLKETYSKRMVEPKADKILNKPKPPLPKKENVKKEAYLKRKTRTHQDKNRKDKKTTR